MPELWNARGGKMQPKTQFSRGSSFTLPDKECTSLVLYKRKMNIQEKIYNSPIKKEHTFTRTCGCLMSYKKKELCTSRDIICSLR